LINDGHLFCKTELNLDSCVAILNEWNENLKLHCGDETIRLAFDYVHNLKGKITSYNENNNANVLLLCLYKENSCVSSIEIEFYEQNAETNELGVSVNFKTNEKYEGKKYNLFLQCMAVILCYNLQNGNQNKKMLKLNVTASNPISAYTPIKYLNGEIIYRGNNNKITNFKNIKNKDEITFQQINELYVPNVELYVEIPVDENNVKKATKKATELLSNGNYIKITYINNFKNKDEITFQQINELYGPKVRLFVEIPVDKIIFDEINELIGPIVFLFVEIPVDENNVKNATKKATKLLVNGNYIKITDINNFENNYEITFQQINELYGPKVCLYVEIPADEIIFHEINELIKQLYDPKVRLYVEIQPKK
jgi:predicted Holliday junction resolvase-like endonuclease